MNEHFSVDDLLMNDSFLKYCYEPNSAEGRKWQQWIAGGKLTQETADEARKLALLLGPGLSNEDIAEETAKVRQLISEKESAQVVEPSLNGDQPYGSRRRFRGRQWLYAAAVAASVVIGFTFLKPANNKVPAQVVTLATAVGEQEQFRLPDGSMVTLNSNSTLHYDNSFNVSDRKVRLTGKAFFQVTKNLRKPFSVQSDNFMTTVLGTSFYVDGEAGNNFSVQLLEGKVKIKSSADEETILQPGEQARWMSDAGKLAKTSCDTAYLQRWLSGEIVFNKTPVPEAFDMLQQWYGVVIEDRRQQKNDIEINGRYRHAKLGDILKVICFTLNCNTLFDNDKIIIQ